MTKFSIDFSKIDFSSNTGIQQEATRRRIAEQYRETIEYRNYILHLDDLKDEDEIEVGDFILSTVNLVFQNILMQLFLRYICIKAPYNMP